MNMWLRTRVCLAIVACALSLTGCGENKIELHDVHGAVTLRGKPLTEAMITFVPKTGAAVRGVIAADGTYRIEAPPGLSHISIMPMPAAQPAMTEDPRAPDQIENYPRESAKPRPQLPAHVLDHKTSKLSYDVRVEGDNRFDIAL